MERNLIERFPYEATGAKPTTFPQTAPLTFEVKYEVGWMSLVKAGVLSRCDPHFLHSVLIKHLISTTLSSAFSLGPYKRPVK